MIEILKLQYDDNFVGREEETQELKEKIEKNEIVVVTGDRGIGKTNLIKVVEKDFENQKECHHIEYGSLFSSGVSRIFLPDKILTGASGGFIVSGGISWKPREPSVLEYMEKSEEKMIFVENAHELKKEEIETIFAATRRNGQLRFVLEVATPYKPEDKLGVDSYEVVKLKGLSDKDIEKIVRRECPKFSDVIVKVIVSLSKGYPYVARSLVYICDRKNTKEEMFEFLKTLRDDDMKHNLDQIHKEILNTLNEDSQVVIKRLAIAPQILTLKLIEAFCKGIPDNLDPALSDLFDRGILVKEEEGKGFYRIYHPLFREYLKSEKIQPIASERWREYYHEAMKNVKTEFDSIYILLEVLNEPDIFKELIKMTENYDAIGFVGIQSDIRGKLDEAICAWDHILEKTKDSDKKWEAIAMGSMGIIYGTKGELDKALQCFETAKKLSEKLGIKGMIAIQLENMGITYKFKGEFDKALQHYEQALKLHEELEMNEGIAADYNYLGSIYRLKGDIDKALEFLEKALKLDRELGTKGEKTATYGKTGISVIDVGIADDYGELGILYKTKRELDTALQYYEQALKLFEEGGIKEGVASQLGNIGVVYAIKGELSKALRYYEQALKLNEEIGRREGMAWQFGNMGMVHVNKGELDKALMYYANGLRIFKDVGDRINTARTLMNIGDILIRRDEKESALNYYFEAQDIILDYDYSLFEGVSKRINMLLGAD